MIPLPDSTEVTALGNALSHHATSGHNLATHGHTRMELASQPPPSHNVYHNFPHIIIGGQPFYLIPSDPEDCAAFETGDPAYAYPQNVAPIYEEIDREAEERAAGSGYQAGARTLHLAGPLSQAALHHGAAKLHPGWTGNKSLSPRRPPPSSNSSIYYYADTLRRGMGEVAESDSGVSSENTPQHRGRGAGPGPWLHRPAPAQPRPPSDPSQERANRSDQSSFVQTQVFLTNVPSKQKIVKL